VSDHRSAAVWSALGDPNRRQIVEMLASGGPTTATGLAGELSISRQAAAKHLSLLTDAGLTTSTRRGRETHYHAEVQRLAEVTKWIATVEGQWAKRLGRLRSHVETRPGAALETD